MKKLNVAIIGQGRSGRNIHGKFFLSEANTLFNVKYAVDADEFRREAAERDFEGCKAFATYEELFGLKDIDLVVNATYSQMHYPITLDLINHGFNVLVEKPFGQTKLECQTQIKAAEEKGVVLAVFQQTFLAPYYLFAKDVIASGKLGDIKEVTIRFNGFARRWDWQTLLKNCAGGLYNTGPHPVGIALGFLDFDENVRVAYSKLDRGLTSGDGDDFAKVILTAPGKPVVDVEVSSIDAYSPFNVKIQGSRGTFKCNTQKYEMTYIVDGENPEMPVIEGFLKDAEGKPIYCTEELKKHVEEGEFDGTAFNAGTARLYEQLYYKITEGKPMTVTPEMAAEVIKVIAEVHAQNPLELKF
ncbi:MAG: Gfo/Idh/MocA family oxidoreductase [Ruminococcaceae bacterium]|nr:Gfo/Idh/MocA family oxidoreductase [Oscillospiraceae bacterium]